MEMIFLGFWILCAVISILAERRSISWWQKVAAANQHHLCVLMSIAVVVGLYKMSYDSSIIWLLVTIISTAMVYMHFTRIKDFFPFSSKEVPDSDGSTSGITLLAVNVRMKNNAYQKLLDLIERHNPAIIFLTETSNEWIDHIQTIKKDYAYFKEVPLDNTYGMAIYSKNQLTNTRVEYLVDEEVPSIHTEIAWMDHPLIQFIGVHPKPPAPWTSPEDKDLEMIKIAAETNWNNFPSIVTGDLNDVGWSTVTKQFKAISALKDPRIGRGFYNTYNANIPFIRYPIDHFFLSDHFKVKEIRRLPGIGSDHFPVWLSVAVDAT